MLVAGEMLQTRPVTRESWGGDAWANFMSRHGLSRSDGLWVADATDLFPFDLPEEVAVPEVDRKSINPEDHRLVGPLLGISNGLLAADWMPISGSWSIKQDVTFSVRTVLAAQSDAAVALFAILTDEKFFQWFPEDAEEIARHFGEEGHSVRSWLRIVQHPGRRLDRHDPYGCSTAMQRPAPADWIQQEFGLSAEDSVVRHWLGANGPAFSAEAWGAESGRGETQWDLSGQRLFVSRAQLLAILERKEIVLLGLAKVQLYHREKRSSMRPGGTSAFSHRTLAFTIDSGGRVWAPTRLPKAVRLAVEALPSNERREFHYRFNAIRAKLIALDGSAGATC